MWAPPVLCCACAALRLCSILPCSAVLATNSDGMAGHYPSDLDGEVPDCRASKADRV